MAEVHLEGYTAVCRTKAGDEQALATVYAGSEREARRLLAKALRRQKGAMRRWEQSGKEVR